MGIEQAIVELLEADTQLAELVGTRIWPGEAPQGESKPHVIYTVVGESRDVEGSLVDASVELDAASVHYSVAKQIAERLRLVLHQKQTESAGTPLRGGFLNDRSHSIDPPQDGRGQGVHHITSDFTVWFLE